MHSEPVPAPRDEFWGSSPWRHRLFRRVRCAGSRLTGRRRWQSRASAHGDHFSAADAFIDEGTEVIAHPEFRASRTGPSAI